MVTSRTFLFAFVCLLGFLGASPQSHSATIDTPASQAVRIIWSAFEYYAEDHHGKIANSFEELSLHFSPEKLANTLRDSPESRFTLYGANGPIDAAKGQLVFVTNNTVIEDRRETPGRYLIWHKDGKFRAEWQREEIVVKVFEKSGRQIPNAGTWQQPNTRHASQMMGIKEPPDLDTKGNVVHARSDPGALRRKGSETPRASLEDAIQHNRIWMWVLGAIVALSVLFFAARRRL